LFARGVLGVELLRKRASTGRRVAGSEELLASSVTFLFPAGDVRCAAVVPRFQVEAAGRFFFAPVAISALKNAREKFPVDKALIKACSSCVSMTLTEGVLLQSSYLLHKSQQHVIFQSTTSNESECWHSL
jgi:hypothetical protein